MTIELSEYVIDAIADAIVKKMQEPCEDAISRQAVLDIIKFEYDWLLDAKGHNADTKIAFSGIKSKVLALPPVNPQEPKTGHWIKDSPFAKPYCSECGNSCFGVHGFNYTISPYCPNCGAKMEESEGEHG